MEGYLYNCSCITFLEKVQPYQTGAEPPLQNDDATHHFLGKSVMKQLPLLLLEVHLSMKECI